MITLNVYRVSNVYLPCAPVAVCRSISNGDQQPWLKLDYQQVLMLMKGPKIPRIELNFTSLVSALFTLYAKLTPVHLTCGLLQACAACPTPRLNLKFELWPSWNNIHETFPTRTAQDTTHSLPHWWKHLHPPNRCTFQLNLTHEVQVVISNRPMQKLWCVTYLSYTLIND